MSQPPENTDSPSHLRIREDIPPLPPNNRLRNVAIGMGVVAVLVAVAPLFFAAPPGSNQVGAYLLSLALVIGLELSLVALALTWRSVFASRLGQWQFTIDGYQSSLYRNLLLGGGLQLLALLMIWIPCLATDQEKDGTHPFTIFLLLASLSGAIAVPWLLQFALNIKAHDLEVYEEGMMIGGFYPCPWQQIVGYHVWEDACTFISLDIRGRGPFEVFVSAQDRKLLLEALEEHVGPPNSIGRTDDLPNIDPRRQNDPFQIFR